MAALTEAALKESQKQVAQQRREGGYTESKVLSYLNNTNQPRILDPQFTDQGINKDKLNQWHNLKARLSYPGTQPTRYQEKNLRAFFIASLPTPKPRTLPEPSADEPGLISIYEQLSAAVVPRKPRRIPPPIPENMGINSDAMKAAASAKKNEYVTPPSPENTSSSSSDDETAETEPPELITPPSSQSKSKHKAPVASMTKKPASTVPAKRKKVVNNDECKDGKKEAGEKQTTAKKGVNKDTAKVEATPLPSVPVEPASAMDPTAFSSPVFDVFVGKNKQQFAAHQSILAQSPALRKACEEQARKKGRAKTSILLPNESPTNFGALLQYLYTGNVYNNTPADAGDTEAEAIAKGAKRLAKLYCLGANYELGELQNFITKKLHESKLWERLPGMEFFELAEKLFPDDPDEADNDSFAKFFAHHAPAMIKTVPENRVCELLRMVSSGGAYAEAIFMAFSTAARAGPAKAKENEVSSIKGTKEDGKEDVHQDKKARLEGPAKAQDSEASKQPHSKDPKESEKADVDQDENAKTEGTVQGSAAT